MNVKYLSKSATVVFLTLFPTLFYVTPFLTVKSLVSKTSIFSTLYAFSLVVFSVYNLPICWLERQIKFFFYFIIFILFIYLFIYLFIFLDESSKQVPFAEYLFLYFTIYLFIYFSFIFISWRLIILQDCSVFCHTLT